MTPSIATNPLYQHFAPQIEINEDPQKSVLIDLANDTKKIAQVFPLMNKFGPNFDDDKRNYSRSSSPRQEEHRFLNDKTTKIYNNYETYEKDEKENLTVNRNPQKLSLNVQKYGRNPAYNARSGSFNVQYPLTPSAAGVNSQPITPSPHSKAPVTPFLSVQPQTPFRALSDSLLAPIDDSELRRASFDTSSSFRRSGTGRLLPSTEHLEKKNPEELPRYDGLPQIVAPVDEEAPPIPIRQKRRASFLPRSEAIETPSFPRKQTSSPLPQQNHRIYDRGHIYSRSWNAEYYDEDEDRLHRQIYADEEMSMDDPRGYYNSLGQSHHPSLPPPIPSHMLVPPQITFTRQTKSFDAQSNSFTNDLLPTSPRYPPLERRSFSERERQQQQQFIRQATIPEPVTEVARECHGLWQARNVLEGDKIIIYGKQNASTDLSDDGPSAVSTSFESNTESVNQGDGQQSPKGPLLELPRQTSNADAKRQKYRSLLAHRQFQQTCPEACSFESAGSDSTSKFGSSLDSSELNGEEKSNGKRPRYRSMMHLTRKSTNLQKTIAKRTFSAKYVATKSLIRPFFHHGGGASYELQRDYSVDIKSDSLFRDFVRVDPRYEAPKFQPSLPIEYPPGFKPAPRRRSSQIMQAMAQYRSVDNAEYRYQQLQPNLLRFPNEINKGSYHNIYDSKPPY